MNEMINRRSLLQATGALFVTFSLMPDPGRAQSATAAKTVSPDRVDGFLAISTDENPKAAEQYVSEAKLTFPVLWDGDSKASDSFGVEGIPVLFVIDENGKITMVQSGYGYGLEFRLIEALGLKKIPVLGKDSNDNAGN